MTGDHLPECPCVVGGNWPPGACVCNRLRACEARVRERCALEIDHGPQMGNSLEWMLNPIRKHHYERGLDAARDAVAATADRQLCDDDEGCQGCDTIRAALAVVDALRGES